MKTAPRYSNDDYSVAGIVVHTRPENRNVVAESLTQLQGVEVHVVNKDGKLVVTVEEEPGERFIIDRITEINNTEGVISAALVFSQSEQFETTTALDPEEQT
jgi:periplasmic nitrate reductase NapD